MTLTTHIKALTVALAAGLLMLAGPLAQMAETQSAAPPTLTGETLLAFEGSSPQESPTPISVTETCNNPDGTATIDYVVTGGATGPYPGTFEESGTFTLSAPTSPGGPGELIVRTVESFSAEFEIDSAVGLVRGTKSARNLPLDQGAGLCGDAGVAPSGVIFFATGAAVATYEATIETSSGTFADRGTTDVFVADREATTSGQTSFFEQFQESFVSDLLEAKRVLPTTKEQCKDDGWQTYGAFKNQGDCVSFVATGGNNEPGKN
jgi:hypothetical protein